jgi:transcriptional regulator
MHPAPAFHWQDRAAIRDFVRAQPFGTLFAATPDGPRVAHVPVVWEGDDTLAFHLGRGNALVRHLAGATAVFTAIGPESYVSPDWYGLGNDQVPTWNYVAVELEGPVARMHDEDLRAHLDQLGAENEAPLPKTPWTLAKAEPAYVAKLLRGITGFRLTVTAWRGTFKMSQNKPLEARLAAADALDAIGRRSVAALMRATP